jgi:Kdo2-lipid IVA lauroyltransferase/acyltransferase
VKQSLADRILGGLVGFLLRLLGRADPDRASAFCGKALRGIGPWLPQHRVGRENLRAAFPDKDNAWIEATLRGAWENLGRVAGEYVHLGRIWDLDVNNPLAGRVQADESAIDLFAELRDDGKPALVFAAHLGNWELPALAAPAHGLDSAVVYRMPNNRAIAAHIAGIREGLMGRLIRSRPEAVFEMARVLEGGGHLGMLVDQHFSRGVEVTFFGRPCWANPTVARLARQFDCPVIGTRAIRLPGNKFRVEGTAPLDLPRDEAGKIEVKGATQMINTIIEGWVREHPEQWLWFHRRWRQARPRRRRVSK